MYSDPTGYYYLSDSKVRTIIGGFVSLASNFSVYTIAAVLKTASSVILATLTAIPVVGHVLAVLGKIYVAMQAMVIAEAFFTALTRRKGLDITVGWWWGWIPYANFSGRVR